MKTILVPTDFSDNSMHAAQYAATLARAFNADITFVNIYTFPVVVEYEVASNMNTDLIDMQKIAELNLADFTNDFRSRTNFTAERISKIAEYGIVGYDIIEKAESIKADMIVMGTKGAHNFLERWLGTNAQKIVKSAHCPVWIIPEGCKLEYPQNILYAADFKEDESLAISLLLDIANPLGATCKVVHVHEYFEPNVGHAIEATIGRLEDEFEDENITFKNIDREDVVEGLEKYIEGYNPDVLAFAIHEKSFLERIFEISTTNHFVQEAKWPILTFPKLNGATKLTTI
ncbi:MAG: universal stress protein [Bacteroidota bacterium]